MKNFTEWQVKNTVPVVPTDDTEFPWGVKARLPYEKEPRIVAKFATYTMASMYAEALAVVGRV